jgi:hydroxymethylbilane synthase
MAADHLRIATRGSALALWQANWVKDALIRRFPGLTVELVVLKTKGDKILDVPLAKVGGKGLFVKEIEEAMLDGRADLAVHSMKDMPAEIPDGLFISAVPERAHPGDALVSRDGRGMAGLPEGGRVGTSSLRRACQLRAARPDLRIENLRGNLETRLGKLESEGLDAIVLAVAGLRRMGYGDRISEVLDPAVMLPAVGQGALCVESRIGDPDVEPLVSALDAPETRTVVMGERAFLHRLEGGCQVPIGGHGRLEDGTFSLDGLVASPDGETVFRERHSGPAASAETVGRELADRLLENGAAPILERLKEDHEIDIG